MVLIDFNDFMGPRQEPITEDRIREVLASTPRRMKLSEEFSDKYGLSEPNPPNFPNWSMLLPFKETFSNSFEGTCSISSHGPICCSDGIKHMYFFNDANSDPASLDEVREWLSTIGCHVALRDCMTISFALDYDREGGDPQAAYTRAGQLRDQAKPRQGGFVDPAKYLEAVSSLGRGCNWFLNRMTCYNIVDCVVAMPSSKPGKPMDIPRDLANIISKERGLDNLSESVQTIKERPPVKDLKLAERINTIKESTGIDATQVVGKNVLLIEDVYQSGASMNCVAMLLQQAGAKRILGLACDKTSSNTDNLS